MFTQFIRRIWYVLHSATLLLYHRPINWYQIVQNRNRWIRDTYIKKEAEEEEKEEDSNSMNMKAQSHSIINVDRTVNLSDISKQGSP